MKHQGFTLFELLITLVILAIILGIGLPSFSAQLQKTRVQTAVDLLINAIQTARSVAVAKNKRTLLIARDKEWHQGWYLFVDENQNGLQDIDEPTLLLAAPLKKVKIQGNSSVKTYISFVGTGEGRLIGKSPNSGAFMAGTLTICPEYKGTGIKLVLSRGGRLRYTPITEEECLQS
ncbi:prepilin-type N-terminal cleavage/methylation domain-containing protein [Cellvibrio japonicus]|nr:prepilin-type N-terminal cleavage/methylation domain-containing protein [Cellvibrio japonicus]QEI17854.1 prepilin-type N-terminal cleavage/methylation domain-containing protein [Cellvibrio japonicus]QEI21429.1 prepilin-type N-terminal cleavage/methylation domain-containing protein [Cellvibrio japonicus]